MPNRFSSLIENCLYTGRTPIDDDIAGTLNTSPKLFERISILERLKNKITDFVETFIEGIAGE